MVGKARSRGGSAAIVVTLIALSLLGGMLAGCGSSSSSSSSSSGATTTSTAATAGSTETSAPPSSPPASTSPSESGTSPPTSGFSKKAKPVSFGYEAKASERKQASEILEKSLKARAASEFATQCKTLSQPLIEAIEKSRYKVNCPQTLRIEALLIPASKTADTMQGPIAALRVQGPVGYALYHGKGGNDYAVRMELENGEWKVGEVLTEKLP
jgi:hypothetical protein